MFKSIILLSCLISFSFAQDYHATQNILDIDNDVIQKMGVAPDFLSLSQKFFNKSIDQVLKMVQAVEPAAKIQPGNIYLSDKKMRVEMQIKGKKTTIIFRMDKNKLYSIDDYKKEYLVLDLEHLRQMQKKAQGMVQNAMSHMGDMLKKLTPEQRAQMEGLFGGKKKKPFIKVYATGKAKTINGFSTTEYRVEGAKKMEQLWIAKSYPQMRRLFEQMQDAFPDDAADEKQIWGKIKTGWPARQITIISENYGNAVSVNVGEITSIQKTHLSADIFEPPADYKKTTMDNMVKDGMGHGDVR